MMGKDTTYRLGVTISVGKGTYGYGTIVSKEFEVSAPLGILRKIDISNSTFNLFHDALNALEDMPEEEG
jgi:hypothetical protein